MITTTIDDILPIDCKNKIISYLPLYDILSYSCTSKASLQNTLNDLCKRREKLSQTILWNGEKIVDSKNEATSLLFYKGNRYKNDSNFFKVMELPSILDRIESVYHNLSSNHYMYEAVHELLSDLAISKKCGKNNEFYYSDIHSSKSSNRIDFTEIFVMFQKLIKVHKLHAKILKSAINGNFLKNIVQCDGHYLFQDTGNQVHFELDQYLGDVNIAFIFMGNISSGLVEGVSEDKWLKSISTIATKQMIESNDIPTFEIEEWYKYWIFLHSSFIRSTQLSNSEMNEFGLLPNGIMKKSFFNNDNDHNELHRPPSIFKGKFKTRTMLKVYRSLVQCNCLMRVAFRSFGCLGPSFRGRDSVRSHSIYLKTAIECFLSQEWATFEEDVTNGIEGDMQNIDGIMRSSSATTHTMQLEPHNDHIHQIVMSLGKLHRESRKIRPMSCAPHTINMETSYISL